MNEAVNHPVILIRGLRDGTGRTETVFVPIRPDFDSWILSLGILYAKARCDVRFGIINQLPNQDITHFKVEMQCPGLNKSVVVRKIFFFMLNT